MKIVHIGVAAAMAASLARTSPLIEAFQLPTESDRYEGRRWRFAVTPPR